MNVSECKKSKKYCHKSIGIGIGNTLALLLLLTIIFTGIVDLPAVDLHVSVFLPKCCHMITITTGRGTKLQELCLFYHNFGMQLRS